MRVAVVGAGPAGLLVSAGLARRGHHVVAVDRDAGPPPPGWLWRRRGVTQFHHAHGFRPQVRDVLARQWPQALDAWTALGAVPRDPGLPAGVGGGVASRRSTFERALRAAAAGTPGVDVRQGQVDALVERAGRVTGVVVDGTVLDADLVVDASGRSGRLLRHRADPDDVPARAAAVPTEGVGGDCGIAYLNRTYQLRPGAGPGPANSPLGWSGSFDGYNVLLFTHERGHFSVVVVRPTVNPDLLELRDDAPFAAACRAVPGLADWTDPARAVPTSSVSVGGTFRNTYRRQPGLAGVVAVGDSVSTTAPTAGRGVALAFLQVEALLDLLDADADAARVGGPFGAWCDREILPWVLDHVHVDGAAARRWQGHDIDLDAPLPSDLVVAAAQADPRIGPHVGAYLAMTGLPQTLRTAEPMAHEVYRSGWRPPFAAGPGVAELVEIARAAAGPRGRARRAAAPRVAAG